MKSTSSYLNQPICVDASAHNYYQRPAIMHIVLLLILSMLVYVLPGTLGHSPWKQDEAYSFGIIHHMLETGQMLVPTNAGQPFMEKPPLYYWTATFFAAALSRWLPVYDAARLASSFYAGISFLFIAMFAQASFRARSLLSTRVLMTVALYAGTIGMVKHSHDLFTDVSLCAGTAVALFGLLQLACRETFVRLDAAWFGLGIGMAAMSKGVFIPLVLVSTAFTLPMLVLTCRRRDYAVRLCWAFLFAAPLVLAWPIALYLHSKELFNEWFWQNNVGRFIGFSVPKLGAAANHTLVIEAFLFFAFPVGVLALFYVLSGGWRKARVPYIAVPLLFVTIGLVVLQASATSRQLYLLPFTGALSVLAARGLMLISSRTLQVISRILSWVFGTLGIGVWLIYLASLSSVIMQKWLYPLGRWLPLDYAMPIQPFVVLFALMLTILWFLRGVCLSHNIRLATAQQWVFGVALVWALPFTLLLPWIDQAKGYGPVYEQMRMAIDEQWRPGDCLSSVELGESEAPLLYFYTGIMHQPVVSPAQAGGCNWLLIEGGSNTLTPQGWKPVWKGSRDGDTNEFLHLFSK